MPAERGTFVVSIKFWSAKTDASRDSCEGTLRDQGVTSLAVALVLLELVDDVVVEREVARAAVWLSWAL